MDNPKYICESCGLAFQKLTLLKRHKSRKTPCKPRDVETSYRCKHCNKIFSSRSARDRHVRDTCRISNDGKTLNEKINKVVDEKTQDLKLENSTARDLISTNGNSNNTTVNNTTNNNNINITVVNSFDDPEKRLLISAEDIKEIFEENEKLRTLVSDEKYAQTYGKLLHEFAAEALMEIVKKAHQKAECQNIYQDANNPKQVNVLSQTSEWVMIPFKTAQTKCFDRASKRLTELACDDKERKTVGIKIESGATKVPGCYGEDEERILKETEDEMRQHLISLSSKTKKANIKAAPLQKTNPPPLKLTKLAKQKSYDADIKKIISDFMETVPLFKEVVNWDDYAAKTMKSIIKKSEAPETIDTKGTIERYFWEMSEKESSTNSNAKKVAAKLSKLYTEKLNQA